MTSRSRAPRRVCMVSYSFYDSDNRVIRYAEALAARGDQVDVFALGRPGQAAEQVVKGVRLKRLQTRVRDESGPLQYLIRILRFFFRASASVSFAHFRNRYDLAHVHNVPDFLVFCALLLRLTGTRIVLDLHDLTPELYQHKFGRHPLLFRLLTATERAACAFSHSIVVPTDIWKERVIGRSTTGSKVQVFMNYPDSKFTPRGRAEQQRPIQRIVYAGSLLQHQGVDIAVRAMAAVKQRFPATELHVYGEGPDGNALEILSRELDVSDCVHFHAPVPVSRVPAILREADLGVVPKRADGFGNEAFSTKTLELMAVGVPVVVSDTLVDTHYYDSNVVRFFTAGDADSLAGAIIDLIEHPGAAAKLAANAAEFVRNFSWEEHRKRYYDFVDTLIG